MKRGYDNFGGSSGGYRGGGHSGSGPYPPGFKKYRRDDVDPVNPTPSKVLHIRNLTPETTEADLLNALSHFGNVAYTTLMANGHMVIIYHLKKKLFKTCFLGFGRIFNNGRSTCMHCLLKKSSNYGQKPSCSY